MTHFGKIKSYDSDNGTGMITPDKGGVALPFRRKDLEREAQEPTVNQRFGYETSEVDGGDKRAIDLQPQQGEGDSVREQQARAQQG